MKNGVRFQEHANPFPPSYLTTSHIYTSSTNLISHPLQVQGRSQSSMHQMWRPQRYFITYHGSAPPSKDIGHRWSNFSRTEWAPPLSLIPQQCILGLLPISVKDKNLKHFTQLECNLLKPGSRSCPTLQQRIVAVKNTLPYKKKKKVCYICIGLVPINIKKSGAGGWKNLPPVPTQNNFL